MAIIKCKMCGGDLNITEGVTVAECEYCGTKQTVPNVDSEKKTSLFLRAEKLRRDCDFDRAAAIYDSIITDFPAEPEAYWGLVLCKYGIEYVDDPATGKKVPTCHRSSYDSVMEDENLEKVMECADAVARRVYREEAKAIEEIRKGILEVSGKEPPYDIFICYKETDENGERTVDSVLAQDVYDALTEKGYRVFFSRITLEDKLGTEYEPYIFAALNSAKVMLVFGTDYEYFNAVWVKNEWSRYLKLMAGDKSKHLIPCYKGVDAYDMPKEFQKLQAQDLGKVGAVQDLLRGIEKLLPRKQEPAAVPPAAATGPTVESLLKRGQMFLEDENWESASEYFDKVLDMDPECAEAYMGKFCVERQYAAPGKMAEDDSGLPQSTNLGKALRFAVPAQAEQWKCWQADAERRHLAREQQYRAAFQKRVEHLEPHREKLLALHIKPLSGSLLGLCADGRVLSAGRNEAWIQALSNWTDMVAVSSGADIIAGLQANGTVRVAAKYLLKEQKAEVAGWRNIISVACSNNFVAGLQNDGSTVWADNYKKWTNVVSIYCGEHYALGLKRDGTVEFRPQFTTAPFNLDNVLQWDNVVSLAGDSYHIIGLRTDGTVVAAGRNADGQCSVSSWRDIVAIACSCNNTVGLKKDGTVVVTGKNSFGQCNVSGWTDIVAIDCIPGGIVGLRADGTVVTTMDSYDVSGWNDVLAIHCCSIQHRGAVFGLRADGTVLAAGEEPDKLPDMAEWKLFESVEELERSFMERRTRGEAERRAMEEAKRTMEDAKRQAEKDALQRERARKQKIDSLVQERSALWAEKRELSLFSVKRRKEIEAWLAAIEEELRKLREGD